MANPKTDWLSSGSRWHRWDPHIHAPGTVLNDQFKGKDAWETYLTALEALSPTVRALGITDYYSLETYKEIRNQKSSGRLPDCELIFPNVEMRLGVGTLKGAFVNVHLLVSPEDASHVVEIERFLSRLEFRLHEEVYRCTRQDLIRLGQETDTSISDELKALEQGSRQFKVSFDQLRTEYRGSAWAKSNILIAVAGSSNDGTAGVRDAADTALREDIERLAHIIFASSAAQREFWLGEKSLNEEQLRRRYGGLKPCLHGSDAHDITKVGQPTDGRYTWIKGAVEFDALRQACIEPRYRAYVGSSPPAEATPSQVISDIEIGGASWATTPRIGLNPGLVAIIGARGSGKTALADIIACGCKSIAEHLSERSFLMRARELLVGSTAAVTWGDGGTDEAALDGSRHT